MAALPLVEPTRYAGVPSPAMRARYSEVAPEVLRLCCVLADIMYDIATTQQQHEDVTPCPVDSVTHAPVEPIEPIEPIEAASRASSRTRAERQPAQQKQQQPSRRQKRQARKKAQTRR